MSTQKSSIIMVSYNFSWALAVLIVGLVTQSKFIVGILCSIWLVTSIIMILSCGIKRRINDNKS